MKIRTINDKNLSILTKAFSNFLLDNGVPHSNLGIYTEDENITAIIKRDDTVSEFSWNKNSIIGYEPEFIAQEILTPMLPRLKGEQRA